MARTITWLAVAALLSIVCLGFSSSSQVPAPVPPDVTIQSPDPALPAEVSSLVGKWVGQWDSPFRWDAALYVEKVDKDSAQVVYSFGEYTTGRRSCHCEPSWVRVQHAQLKYSAGGATMEFHAPVFGKFARSHTISGTFQDASTSSPVYFFSFALNTHEPGVMKGRFTGFKGPG